ncbi:unnamed protein product [Brugia pahangi]|uniref:Uncharacterized protein n=1 Tax=Brugia pahangi TaxID=6280 RepID=A0A0N4T504_BRUPA|nr:unnamed protein product [Brugia pahangi]
MKRSSHTPIKLVNWRSFTILHCCSVYLQMNESLYTFLIG